MKSKVEDDDKKARWRQTAYLHLRKRDAMLDAIADGEVVRGMGGLFLAAHLSRSRVRELRTVVFGRYIPQLR